MKIKKIACKLQAIFLCAAMLISILPSYAFSAERNKDQTSNSDIVRALSLSYKLKDSENFQELNAPYKIPDSSKVEKLRAFYSFKLEDNIDPVSQKPQRTMKGGDYYLIDIPQELKILNGTSGSIKNDGNEAIANYSFIESADKSWQVKVEFTTFIDDVNEYDIYGELQFDFNLDLSDLEGGNTKTIYIPINNNEGITIEVTKPVPPPTTPLSLTKKVVSYNNKTRELVWNVEIKPNKGIFSDCVFTDTIDTNSLELKSIKHGNIILKENEDYTYDKTSGNLVYTIKSGRDGANFKNITITTEVKRSVYGKINPTVIKNKANLSGGASSVNIDSNTATQEIKPEWLSKSGTKFQGNKILWKIIANSTEQAMYNAVITDKLQSDITLDKNSVKVDGNKIKIYDNSHSPVSKTEIYGIYTENQDGSSLLKIYLPRGKENASNNKVNIELVTSVDSPDSVITSGNGKEKDPSYSNVASLDCNFITDGNGEATLPPINLDQIGVAVPYLSVSKTHSSISADDERNGTITWNFTAASNLSEYGKSQITDILPSDQDFIPDEIYCGKNKINKNTEPKAEISTDGRKLTITFSSSKALASEQKFTVKTKIKQDEYGQNINRNFLNKIEGMLFSEQGTMLFENPKTANDSVSISNTVISKAGSEYKGTSKSTVQNPKENFTITINNNLMPLKNVIVTDDLSKIITEFKASGSNNFKEIKGVKWTLVADSVKITRKSGDRDTFNLDAIASSAKYQNNILTVDFGSLEVNDKYEIKFTAELDVAQNSIFKQNGFIRCKGNIAEITAEGLKPGKISSSATGNSNEIKNEVLGKTGVHLEKEQQALWTINLNQHRVTLDNTKVIDVLPEGLTLDPTSIKLYKNVIGIDGKFITGDDVENFGESVAFEYTYEALNGANKGKYVLKVNLPTNDTSYILRFATDIDKKLLGKTINNSAYYAGDSGDQENTDSGSITLSGSAGGGSTKKTSVTVNKFSKDDGSAVDGAVFDLNWMKDGTTPVFVRSQTAEKGTAIFYGLTRGEKYTITEKTAPEGYLLDDPEPIEFTAPTGTENTKILNVYNTPVKSAEWMPEAIKKLSGKDIIHTFSFEISDGTNTLLTGETKNKLSNGDYTVEFKLKDGISKDNIIKFTDSHIFADNEPAGTEFLATEKTLYMKEIQQNLPGYGFDDTVYTLNIKVYNIKGQPDLKIVIEDETGNVLSDNSGNFDKNKIPVFNNTYNADGSIQFNAEKILKGHALAADQFEYEIYENDRLIETVGNKEGRHVSGQDFTGNINFSSIKYTISDIGTKVYKIVEKDSGLAGYTYDKSEYSVTVKVTDNDNGILSSEISSIKKTVDGKTSDVDKISFENTYTAQNTDVTLSGSKTLSGRKIEDGQFTFKIDQIDSNGVLIQNIGSSKNIGENITFSKQTYSQSDIGLSYYYSIIEVNDSKPGYTYDSSEYVIKITVNDNNDGTLSTVQEISKNGQQTDTISFSNKYSASGEAHLTALKKLTGKTLPENQFSFVLSETDKDGNKISEIETVKNGADGKISFSKLNYSENDAGKVFYYTVTETDDGAGGYTYDKTVYAVQISVTDNGDGTLNTVSKITSPDEKSEIVFSNTYITSDTSVNLNAQKILNGRLLEDVEFHFNLDQISENGELIKEIETVNNDLSGEIRFSEINYSQADMGKTYYYRIQESDTQKPGYTYDNSVFTVKVNVIDNNDGTLSTEVTTFKNDQPANEIVFSNTYTTSDVVMQFNATKTLNGRVLEDGQFRYKLTYLGEDGSLSDKVEEVKNKADGTISFSPVTYTQKDMGKTYFYSISETDEQKPGYTYDTSVYKIKVEVIDNGDGTLSTESSITSPENAEEAGFVNIYTTENTYANFSALKLLQGRELEAGQFNFILEQTDENGDLIKEIQKAQNDDSGNIYFDDIVYNQQDMGKSFYYQISEVNEEKPGYLYDSSVYCITINVIDNGDGTLHAEKTITKDGEALNAAVFENKYIADDTSLSLTADKKLSGSKLKDGQFSYTLNLMSDDQKSMDTIGSAKNKADGSINFPAITYTQNDMGKTYIYTLSETNDQKPGYQYDNTVYTITVSVIDNGDGTLRTEYTITKQGKNGQDEEVSDMSFSNVYTASGFAEFKAVKMLTGASLSDKSFEFVLKDNSGKEIQKVSSDSDGNIVFSKIYFDQEKLGVYKYTVSEVIGDETGITYDSSVYLLTVTVTDNGDGTLKISILTEKQADGQKSEANRIEFMNKYTKPASPDKNEDATKNEDAMKNEEKENPGTLDHNIFMYLLLSAGAAAILSFLKKKEK